MSKESVFYLMLTIMAFGLIGLGCYLMDAGGAINLISGLLCFIIGFIIGMILYGEKWTWW